MYLFMHLFKKKKKELPFLSVLTDGRGCSSLDKASDARSGCGVDFD